MRVLECVAEHYEVQDMGFGRIYGWCSEGVVVEEVWQEVTFKKSDLLAGSVTACECGDDKRSGVQEEMQDEVVDHLIKDKGAAPGVTGTLPGIPGCLFKALVLTYH